MLSEHLMNERHCFLHRLCVICLSPLNWYTQLQLIGLFAKHNGDKLYTIQLTKLKVSLFSLYYKLSSFPPPPRNSIQLSSEENSLR
jgi:hypothetical protein